MRKNIRCKISSANQTFSLQYYVNKSTKTIIFQNLLLNMKSHAPFECRQFILGFFEVCECRCWVCIKHRIICSLFSSLMISSEMQSKINADAKQLSSEFWCDALKYRIRWSYSEVFSWYFTINSIFWKKIIRKQLVFFWEKQKVSFAKLKIMENLYWSELISCEYDEMVPNDDENAINVTTFLNEQNDAATLNVRQCLTEQDQMESV